ncbi:hypothetical protein JHK82_050833 [Glycine max]|uniref:PPM-type phosphatase domain-containing protein n=1 Tax=Glycine max TaxID=3847 RepID=I1N2G6_SOYBN|nr:probable protein phosphatase 2C 4 [Glycine max]KAG5092055.1 hypothetical protein JHK82_050833 [Glycine max]KAG5095136.1 hypothetical protein JHK84_050724 [Glycine max]KAH1155000.1 hypothetical protein GYH30_050341 [Glycine max]KRG99924.1 hypothetical protein GLYMA_18G180400v4 [Glycine max]|eukprot:XP_003551469.1 probable protein phosphatase 2C 4 [Glycine max]
MGNRISNLCLCSSGDASRRFENRAFFLSKQHQNSLGNSICYVRPDTCRFSVDDITLLTFRSVSGATVSANTSATPSTSLDDSLQHSVVLDSSASFESSGSFTSTLVPFQHQHARGFSVGGSTERGLYWGLRDRVVNGEGSIEKGYSEVAMKKGKRSKRNLKKVLSRAFLSIGRRSVLKKNDNTNARVSCSTGLSLQGAEGDNDNYLDGDECDVLMGCENLHWAQGRAGEDRVHIVICEDHGWVFVGIYDGFNGPDATDFLLNNLFYAVNDELKEMLCAHNKFESMAMDSDSLELEENVLLSGKGNGGVDGGCSSSEYKENYPIENEELNLECASEGEEGMNGINSQKVDLSHSDVLQALSEALRKTEDAFLKTVDEMIGHNPVLAMMGSCVLVMLMKGQDVYLMNVGDSRAVLATHTGEPLQLTMDHSTQVKEEVYRIRREHPDDPLAITKGRVKGRLSVTRAFGAGFLKQPKLNNAVLETFRVTYIGESPYITCFPSLHHHKLSTNDKFLILSSDGLYQYFTNEEAAAKVESFITMFPDRDPAQLLIEEALGRAAKKAGMEFHELLDIPQGERRNYHDDISIVIISIEGKIWRSLV